MLKGLLKKSTKVHVSSNLYNSCPDIYPKQSLNHLHQPNLFFFSPNICSLKSLLWHKLVSLPWILNHWPFQQASHFSPVMMSSPNTPGNAVFLKAHLVILSLSLLSKINFLHSHASTRQAYLWGTVLYVCCSYLPPSPTSSSFSLMAPISGCRCGWGEAHGFPSKEQVHRTVKSMRSAQHLWLIVIFQNPTKKWKGLGVNGKANQNLERQWKPCK